MAQEDTGVRDTEIPGVDLPDSSTPDATDGTIPDAADGLPDTTDSNISDNDGPYPPDSDVPDGPPHSPGLPLTLQGSVSLTPQPVVGGVGLPPGLAVEPEALALMDGDGAQPAAFRALSRWSDGSLRWVEVMTAASLPSGTADRQLIVGEGVAFESSPPELPVMHLRLTSAADSFDVELEPAVAVALGGWRVTMTERTLPADRRLVDLHLERVEGPATIEFLSLDLALGAGVDLGHAAEGVAVWGDGAVSVRRFVERGPMALAAIDGGARYTLVQPIPGNRGRPPVLAVDQELTMTFTLLFSPADSADVLAAQNDLMARPFMDITALQDSGAAEVLALPTPGYDDAVIRPSIDALRSMMSCTNPAQDVACGPINYGDGFATDGNLAYAGFYNQEYGPAVGLVHFGLRYSDPELVSLVAEIARHYADVSLSHYGGSYQHRSTQYAMIDAVTAAYLELARTAVRDGRSAPLSCEALGVALIDLGSLADGARASCESVEGSAPERETAGLRYALAGLADRGMNEAQAGAGACDLEDPADGLCACLVENVDSAGAALIEGGEPTIAGSAASMLCGVGMRSFSGPTIETVFAPFFARYGGDWSAFPHLPFFPRHPNPQELHGGGHTLVEGLVWGHLLTGSDHLRDAALRSARYHIAPGGVIERAIDVVTGQAVDDGLVWARNLGWPLINLVALRQVTQEIEPALDSQLVDAGDRIVAVLATLAPGQYKSLIHAGVCAEALARWHAQTGSEEALTTLQALIGSWTTDPDRWDEVASGFKMEPDQGVVPNLSCMLTYGVAYAAAQGGPSEWASVARRNFDSHCLGEDPTRSFKIFGQRFRNLQRAMALPALR